MSTEMQTSYESYKVHNNRNVLVSVLSMALLIEIVYVVFNALLTGEFSSGNMISSEGSLGIRFWFFFSNVLVLLITSLLYEKIPTAIGSIAVFLVLANKLMLFIFYLPSAIIIAFWFILLLVLAVFYMDVLAYSIGVIISFILFTYMLIFEQYVHYQLEGYLWIMLISLVLAIGINLKKGKKEFLDFIIETERANEAEKKLNRYRYDAFTGFYTKDRFEEYVNYELVIGDEYPTFLVAIDLDDVELCNTYFGRDIGDNYIHLFSKVIKFIKISEDDALARVSGDEFILLLTKYPDLETLVSTLERYNRILKAEFYNSYNNKEFIPNFCYGITQVDNTINIQHHINTANDKMIQQKGERKKGLGNLNSYKSFINYTSLFASGTIVAIVWLVEEGFPIGYISDNVEEVLGYSSEKVITTKARFMDLIHPDDLERVSKDVQEQLKKKAHSFEQKYRVRKADGTYIWIRDLSVPVWDDKHPMQINGYIYDIDLVVESENLLEMKNQRLERIVSATNAGIYEWNINTDITTVNERFAEITGYTIEELTPFTYKTWAELLNKDDLIVFERELNDYLKSGLPFFQTEYRFIHKDGKIRWIYDNFQVTEWNEDGSPKIMFGAIRDVTEIKTAEGMLQHAEKLSALGRLAGGIAHDMNNQLMMIQSLSDYATKVDSLEVYQQTMDNIMTIGNKASSVVKQLMSFSKNHSYEAKYYDMNDLLDDFLDVLRHTFNKDIVLNLIKTNEPSFVLIDRALVENGFLNICLNARDAMVNGGELKIVVENKTYSKSIATHTGDLAKGEYVVIRFIDTGIGISNEAINKIFEPFYSTKEKGSGLGLASIIGLVREHKGGVRVESVIGEGTKFNIYLPRIRELKIESETVNTKTEQTVINKSQEIIIVDDEPVICEVMTGYFEMKGCKVTAFTDSIEAFEYFKEGNIKCHVLLLDILMPGMTGIELFEKVMELDSSVKVIFLSGFSPDYEFKSEYKENIITYMEKPVKLDTIYDCIFGRSEE